MREYTEEFKGEAVKLVTEGRVGVAQAARDLGVNINTLSGWLKKHREKSGSPGCGEQQSSSEQEIRRLRKENDLLRMERDILKKAVGIFSKELR